MKTKKIDNSDRPAQPEPGEDPAAQSPSLREEYKTRGERDPAVNRAIQKERKRQTGE